MKFKRYLRDESNFEENKYNMEESPQRFLTTSALRHSLIINRIKNSEHQCNIIHFKNESKQIMPLKF